MFWKSLCGTTLVLTVLPVFLVKASVTAWYAFLGTSSEDPEPNVSPEDSVPPPDGPVPPVQAASSGTPASPAAPTPRVFRIVRRPGPAVRDGSVCAAMISPLKFGWL